MRKLFALTLVLFAFSAPGAIKYFTDYPNNPAPSGSFAFPMDTGDHSLGGVPYNYITLDQYKSLLFPNALGVFTNNGAGLVGFSTSLSLTELDALNFFPTNTYLGFTNAPYLATDGDGKPIVGTGLSPTNVLLSAGANITFTTNVDGSVTVAGSATSTNTTLIVQNLSSTYITNTTEYTTNIYITLGFATNIYITTNYANTSFVTNQYVTTSFTTNLTVTQTFNGNKIVVTNVTIQVGGFLTNLNTTGNTVAYWASDKTITNVPNGTGALTNDGSGAMGYYSHFVPDSRTATIAGTANQVTSSAGAQDLSANRTWTLSTPSIFTAPGTIAAVTGYTNQAFTVPGVMTNDDKGKFFSTATLPNALLANSSITVQGAAVSLGGSTLAAGSTPAFGGINFTNLGYGLPTNNLGGGAFVFGGPGTAATLYDTNISAATTLKLFDITACGATAGGIKLYVTCSGGTDRILTFPAGCSGAGLGTPPAVTITNAKAAFFDIIYKPGATAVTNVFWSPVY